MQHTLCRAGMAFALSAATLFTSLTAHAADDWEAMRQGRTRDDVSTWAPEFDTKMPISRFW